MLYDPKWEQQTRADPFTLESLIAWLEKQPADKQYDYENCRGACLYGQYMTAVGVPWKQAGAMSYLTKQGDIYKLFRRAVYFPIACTRPHTFGDALTRARAALK